MSMSNLSAILRSRADESERRGHHSPEWCNGVRFAANQLEAADSALRDAATALYMAGRWDCAALPVDEQARLWEALRDALGLATGTATAAGVAATTA